MNEIEWKKRGVMVDSPSHGTKVGVIASKCGTAVFVSLDTPESEYQEALKTTFPISVKTLAALISGAEAALAIEDDEEPK